VARKAQAAQFAANVAPIIREIQAAGYTSFNAIAGQLNVGRSPPPMVAGGGMRRCGRFWVRRLLQYGVQPRPREKK
jgi:hypothetical protein